MKEKISGVYCITNKINGKIYIGSSLDINHRFSSHRSTLYRNKSPCPKLQAAYNECGLETFNFEIIEICKPEKTDILLREQHYINLFKPEYNAQKSAQQNSIGTKRSRETKQKMSEAKSGEKHWLYGKTHNDSTLEKLKTLGRSSAIGMVSFTVISPSGVYYNAVGITPFTREHQLEIKQFRKLLKGEVKQYKGWVMPIPNTYTTGQLSKLKKFKVYSPTNELIIGEGIQKFCRDNGLDKSNFSKLLHGKMTYVSGYTLYDKNSEELKV